MSHNMPNLAFVLLPNRKNDWPVPQIYIWNSNMDYHVIQPSTIQEISNSTHWTDPEKTWVSNSSSTLGVRW